MRVVTKAFNEFDEQTNNFNFLFVAKAPFMKLILPETFDDILEFHEARRRLWYEKIILQAIIWLVQEIEFFKWL